MDVNAAGLLAQVIPALLVFLALEERLSPVHIPRKELRQRIKQWREAAVVCNLLSLGFCLAIVVTKIDVIALNLFIAGSVVFLLIMLTLLFAGMFGREDEEADAESLDAEV